MFAHAIICPPTDAGCALHYEAQETFLEVVEEHYLARLSRDEVQLLGALFTRLAG